MAIHFTSASSEFLYLPAASVPAGQPTTYLTVAFWWRLAATMGQSKHISAMFNITPDEKCWRVQMDNRPGTDTRISFRTYHGDAASTSTSNVFTEPTAADQHICTTFDSTLGSARLQMYLNGALNVSRAHTGSAIDADSAGIAIGAQIWEDADPTADDYAHMNGDLWEIGVWDRVLSPDEVASLAAGFSPEFFPEGLWQHLKMRNITELRNNAAPGGLFTAYNTPTNADHGQIVYPYSSPVIIGTPSVGPSPQTETVGTLELVIEAPAVSTRFDPIRALVETLELALENPAVTTRFDPVRETVDTLELVLENPPATLTSILSVTVETLELVLEAPASSFKVGPIRETVDTLELVLEAPAASLDETTTITTHYRVLLKIPKVNPEITLSRLVSLLKVSKEDPTLKAPRRF